MTSADDPPAVTLSADDDEGETIAGEDPLLIGTATPGGRVTVEQYAETVHRTVDLGSIGDVLVCELPEDRDPDLAVELPGISYVERNREYRAVDQVPVLSPLEQRPDSETAAEDWALDRINAGDEQSPARRSRCPRVAVLDTGADPDHEALDVAEGTALTESAIEDTAEWADDRGHGTHVAGIVGADPPDDRPRGVCPAADLYPVKVLDETGSGSFGTIAAGICAAVDRNVDVIVLGFSGSQRSLAVRDACRYAVTNDTLVVGAAGNSGPLESSVGYPAAFDSVVAVSAIDRNDEIAPFSSRGSAVELAAPGVEIRSTGLDDQYTRLRGTSTAAPHVAGTAAAVMSRGISAETTRELLAETADELTVDRDRQGNGVVDYAAALAAIPPRPTVQTTSPEVDTSGETATVSGRVLGAGEIDAAAVWFEWRRPTESAWQSTPVQQLDGCGSFETELTALDWNRRYECRACAKIDGIEQTGEPVSLRTGDRVVVETAVATVLGPTAVTVRGRLQHHQGTDRADVWFEYRQSGTTEWETSDHTSVSRPRFADRLDDLVPDTEYEFRVRANAGTALDVGTVGRFRTNQRPTTAVTTVAARETAATEMTLRGRVRTTDDGTDARAWFEYRARGDEEWHTTDRQHVAPRSQYSARVTDIEPGTVYEFRAVAEGAETTDTDDPHTVSSARAEESR
jgi:subtilisin